MMQIFLRLVYDAHIFKTQGEEKRYFAKKQVKVCKIMCSDLLNTSTKTRLSFIPVVTCVECLGLCMIARHKLHELSKCMHDMPFLQFNV